jgi:phospholipid/cholesterol/gamma-HCH transport system ATP-binding protein
MRWRSRTARAVDTGSPDSTPGKRLPAPEVRIDGLEMEFDGEPVLRGATLHVPAGTITVLVGASGSGKSTMMKHILGLLPPDDGSVAIGGQDVWSCSPSELRELRRNLSALHGGATVYEGSVLGSVSLRENLLTRLYEKHTNPSVAAGGSPVRGSNNPYVRLGTEGLLPVEEIPMLGEQAQAWLDKLGLTDVADLLPSEASAGQRRRTALAAALAVDAPLYLLDDPDGAIDVLYRRAVVDAVLGTRARTDATMLLATHDVALARAVAGSVAVLADGRIQFHGDAGEALGDLHRWYGDPPASEPAANIPRTRRPVEDAQHRGSSHRRRSASR